MVPRCSAWALAPPSRCYTGRVLHADLPLFPLGAVLFPGASLQLRIFEPRYLDMVRECTRAESPFGVCLLLDGEGGKAPAAIGTTAHIVDFQSLTTGCLGISVTGGERYQVLASRVRNDGLVRGKVRTWPEEPRRAVPPEFSLLPTILERLVAQFGGAWSSADKAGYDDAAWVGFRLGELLPLQLDERQQLLELTDSLERLQLLQDWIPRFQKA